MESSECTVCDCETFVVERVEPYRVNVTVNGEIVNFIVDTGSELTLMPEKVFTQLRIRSTMKPTLVKLKAYNGSQVKVLGETEMNLKLCESNREFRINVVVVVREGSCPILGRHLLSLTGFNFKSVFELEKCNKNATSVCHFEVPRHYQKVFDTGSFEPISKYSASLYVNEAVKPIKYHADTESRYSQFDLEALCYAFTKFHKFVYGTDIIVFTDCKALMGVFASDTKRKIDDKLSPRVTRYVVFMSRYSYQLHHVSSSHNIADFLSRCSYKNLNYCSDEAEEVPEYSEVIMSISDNTTLDIERVKTEILKDDTLRIVKNYVTNGWPEKVIKIESNARPYFHLRQQLSLDREFLWMGTRLVIPVVLQNAVIRLLHETHSGIVAMKRLARSIFLILMES